MRISIVVPIYNGVLLVERCLNSIYNQTGNFDLELIVIDDGSIDNSVEFINNYSSSIILLKQSNQGPATARNKGIDFATGKYLAFLDADDYWHPDFLKSTVAFLENHAEAVAVSVGQIHKIAGKPDAIAPNFLALEPNVFSESKILNDFYEFWAEHNHVCTGSVLMRTEIAKQTGGQRSDLRITEDLEFWAYMATFGPWGFIPKILFVSDGATVTRQTGWMEKNKKRWASAPTVEDWEKRIIKRLSYPFPQTYMTVRGRIARNLAYSQLLSGREKLARKTILENKNHLPKHKLSLVMVKSAKYMAIWFLLCKFLKFRESNRK